MASLTQEEFNKFYKTNLEPLLLDLEQERVMMQRILKPFDVLVSILGLVMLFSMIMMFFVKGNDNIVSCFLYIIFISVPIFIVLSCIIKTVRNRFIKKLKTNVTSKVLALYGNLHFSKSKRLIPVEEIRNFGLFPHFSRRIDGDSVVGTHKGLDFVISETCLYHTTGSGKHRTTVTDFKGIIVKIQMKKSFKGVTVLGNNIKQRANTQPVNLESVEFMKDRKIYSTDQIEARYILTPSFMEKIEGLQQLYSTSFLISAAFDAGYVYLFIPTYSDFFEIPIESTLLFSYNYYSIYNELDEILSVVDYLNLDRNLGL